MNNPNQLTSSKSSLGISETVKKCTKKEIISGFFQTTCREKQEKLLCTNFVVIAELFLIISGSWNESMDRMWLIFNWFSVLIEHAVVTFPVFNIKTILWLFWWLKAFLWEFFRSFFWFSCGKWFFIKTFFIVRFFMYFFLYFLQFRFRFYFYLCGWINIKLFKDLVFDYAGKGVRKDNG